MLTCRSLHSAKSEVLKCAEYWEKPSCRRGKGVINASFTRRPREQNAGSDFEFGVECRSLVDSARLSFDNRLPLLADGMLEHILMSDAMVLHGGMNAW